MSIESLLPVGSVVILKGGVKRLMICGVRQTNNKDGKEYDYIGVLYPEGYLGDEYRYLFNQEDILEVFFRGYEDEERSRFLERLKNFYDGSDEE